MEDHKNILAADFNFLRLIIDPRSPVRQNRFVGAMVQFILN
jgi:hypothetical protein